ncbi:MAG: M4 family metallopeptidase, partial [Nocardioides sp.]
MIRTHRSTLAVAAISSAALAVGALGLPSQAAPRDAGHTTQAASLRGGDGAARTPGYVDRRQLSGTLLARGSRAEVDGRSKADKLYYRSLGSSAVADLDPLTKTVRNVGKLDGYLTGRSSAPARSVGLGYVRSHLHALGLTGADLSTFRFRQDYVDTIGVHHLSWSQRVAGTPVFGNGLKVNVTRAGQVISVQGSPISGLAALAAKAPTTRLSAERARGDAARNVNGVVQRGSSVASSRAGSTAATTWNNHDYAKRVWFLTPSGLRPGWSTYVQASTGSFQHVVDASNGQVLFRRSTQDNARGDAKVYDYYPGAPKGGKPKVVNFYKRDFVRHGNRFLKGKTVIAWSDVNDDNLENHSEDVRVPGNRHHAKYPLVKFQKASSLCSAGYQCTWDPNKPYSWKTNRKADVTQAFYLASNFHDYLAKGPIGFTTQAGNFSRADNDPLLLNALDGANTLTDNNGNPVGLPDGNHIDNANMSTPPDGTPPTMQMYLFHFPGATDAEDPYVPTSSAFDASVLYHEYTHGLSNRLVVDATGNSTLNDIQAGAMGEAWSDYYAMDYLVTNGFQHDTNADGQVREGKYLIANKGTFRTMAIDCPVGSKAKACTSNYDGSHGGYTYGDFPNITGGPEVHSSGEIWAQTLWDIRKRLGHNVADTVITRGMSLSANDPSYLDMRNAIIQADKVAYGSDNTRVLWKIFAHRGMGYFAGTSNA